MNLFEKVKCKGFYKPFKDGRWLYLDRETLTADAMDNNLADGNNDGTVEKNVEYIEKTYFKHVDRNFIGVIVGYKDIIVNGYLDAVYQEKCEKRCTNEKTGCDCLCESEPVPFDERYTETQIN